MSHHHNKQTSDPTGGGNGITSQKRFTTFCRYEFDHEYDTGDTIPLAVDHEKDIHDEEFPVHSIEGKNHHKNDIAAL